MFTTEVLGANFTLPNKNIIAHLEENSIPFNFADYGQKNLLVTFGDSWTWGDELDLGTRTELAYGNTLAKKLNYDWLNLSVPGAGNQYIGVLFSEFVDFAVNNTKYNNIICVVTLTEVGREFNGWFDRTVDYASWLRNNIVSADDYTKFLAYQNQLVVDQIIADAKRIPTLRLKLATNFVEPIGVVGANDYLLSKSWLGQTANLDQQCYFISPYIFDKFESIFDIEWSLSKNPFLAWAAEQSILANDRVNVLESCDLIQPRYHPNKQLHDMWAEYIYSELI
jgi:hypothetical protein